MSYTQSVVLGVIQGLTEFLPISSSGHLILVPALLGWPDQGLAFDAAVHLGTLAALLLYFRQDLVRMAAALKARERHRGFSRLAGLLLVATIPAGVAGFLFERAIEGHLRTSWAVGASLIWWGLVMGLVDRRANRQGHAVRRPEHVEWGAGLAVGLSQVLALIPGTSRSGITITAGLLLKMDRTTAARFALLLGIPIITVAGGAKFLALLSTGFSPSQAGPLVVGLLVSFASGWGTVSFLVHYLQRGSLLPFVVYRLGLGLLILGALVAR